jgi:hypothetical protein
MPKLKDGILRDDVGNIVQLPGGGVTVNERGNIEVKKALGPDRIVERNAGCWNCRNFNIDQLFQSVAKAARQRDVAVLSDKMPVAAAHRKADATQKFLREKKGFIGVCAIDKADAEFVSYKYLCTSWSGTTGASLARAPGEPLSPLGEEVADKLK